MFRGRGWEGRKGVGKKGQVIRIGTVKYPVHPGRREKRAPLLRVPFDFVLT